MLELRVLLARIAARSYKYGPFLFYISGFTLLTVYLYLVFLPGCV